jgi:hypothetical protein
LQNHLEDGEAREYLRPSLGERGGGGELHRDAADLLSSNSSSFYTVVPSETVSVWRLYAVIEEGPGQRASADPYPVLRAIEKRKSVRFTQRE